MGAWQPDAMYVYIFCFQKVPINFYEMILLFAHRSFRLFISVDIYVFIFLVLCLFITQKYMANNVPASDYPKRPLKDKQLGDINLVQKCTRTICYNQGRFRLQSDQYLLNLGRYIMTPRTYYLCHHPQAGRRLCQWKIPHHI